MRGYAFLLACLSLVSFSFAEQQSQPLCPDYGVNRIGSMNTDGYGVIVYGDFLYWTTRMDGLDLALKLTPLVSDGSGGLRNRSSIIEPNFDWDPAFRVGLGYYFKWRDWDVCLEWTRLRSNISKSEEAGDNLLFPLWARVGSSGNDPRNLINVSGKWDFDYDTLDLLFHPGYFRYKYFAIQPEVGVRGAWIDWKYTINQTFFDTVTNSNVAQHLPFTHDFHGVGLLGGFHTKFFMGYGFHIYTRSLASILYGHFDIDQFAKVEGAQFLFRTDSKQKFWDIRSNIHLAMGLEWERYFANNSVLLNLHIGYEFLIWFNQNQLYRARVETENGVIEYDSVIIERDDLGMNGLTVGARLEF